LGFGSYLLGLNTVGYELTGGSSTPGNVGIVDSTSPKNIIGYGLCIIFIGASQCCCSAALVACNDVLTCSACHLIAARCAVLPVCC
jgi:hypothetical protein